ncbi:MFS transporter [Streptomyces sp. NPDC050658]|uniref:MFS transporter n=1 Tax=unclassified Streptomyces TaxID=2593676 RepID=UPI003419F65A
MTAATGTPQFAGPEVQRRVLTVLVASQALGGAGMAAGITVGALLAQDLLGSTALAGLPVALFTAGAAVGALLIGRISERWGRRPGLALGHAAAALGSIGVIVAAWARTVPLLLSALVVYGAGTVTGLLARYAGTDLAPPGRRGRATGAVLVATTLGAVAGPALVGPTGTLADSLGLPRLTGPFLLAAVVYMAAALVVALGLRPDPLLLARSLRQHQDAAGPQVGEGHGPATGTGVVTSTGTGVVTRAGTGVVTRAGTGVVTGAAVMISGQLVMIAIMAMTPVHLTHHGHSTQTAGVVIGLHVGAMFLPSPLTGLVVDRIGSLPVAASSGGVLLAAGLLAAFAPPTGAMGIALLGTALVLLGIGWNMALVSGTALVAQAAPDGAGASTQGLVDVGMSLAGATGGMVSGLVAAGGGYPLLAVCGGVLALAVIPLTAHAAAPGTTPRIRR